ncbi:MAG: PIN domain-containing protein, partial [Gemmatimonadales bacterium]
MAGSPRRTIVDASALVALIERREPHHAWAVAQARRVTAPMLTCESVLSETIFVLRSTAGGIESRWDMVDTAAGQIACAVEAEA